MDATNNHLSHAVRSTWYSARFTEEEYAAILTMETLMTELQIIGRGYEVIHPYSYIRTKETIWGNSVVVIIITVSFRLASFHPKNFKCISEMCKMNDEKRKLSTMRHTICRKMSLSIGCIFNNIDRIEATNRLSLQVMYRRWVTGRITDI